MSLPIVRFGDVCNLINGKAFKPDDWSAHGEPIIRIQNLNDPLKPFNCWAGSLDRQVLVKPGDVLLAWSGTPGTSFGTHIWRGVPGILNQHIFRVDLDHNRISKEWCVHAVNSRLNRLIEQAHGGVGLKHVTRGMVDDLEIPLPSLAEQRRLATILDHADQLRRKRRQALRRLNELAGAVFHEMFADDFKSSKVNLSEVCFLIRDGTHQTPKYVDSGIPFVTVKNIVSGALDLTETKFITTEAHLILTKRAKPENGDILVSKDGTIGVPCPIVDDLDFSIFVSVALLKLNRDLIDQTFLTIQLGMPAVQKQIREQTKGIAIRHLHLEDFRTLKILLPPIDEQRRFTERVTEIQSAQRRYHEHLSKLDALFASLQYHAFRDELTLAPKLDEAVELQMAG